MNQLERIKSKLKTWEQRLMDSDYVQVEKQFTFLIQNLKNTKLINSILNTSSLKFNIDSELSKFYRDNKFHFGDIEEIPFENEKFDAVIVEGFDKNDADGYVLAQRFKRKTADSTFEAIGNAGYFGNCENVLK